MLDRRTGWEVWSRVSIWVLLVPQIALAIGFLTSSIGVRVPLEVSSNV